jgi:hypothetical protein
MRVVAVINICAHKTGFSSFCFAHHSDRLSLAAIRHDRTPEFSKAYVTHVFHLGLYPTKLACCRNPAKTAVSLLPENQDLEALKGM